MYSNPEVLVRILTHNIRYATSAPFKGEEKWNIRRPGLVNEFRFNTKHNAEAFICLQEVLHQQLVDIDADLNVQAKSEPEWSWIGVGRDDGKQAGEYSPILYRPSVWKLEESRNVWLSETPEKPSKGWDAASTRILTIGVFKHRASKSSIVVMNTHLDEQGAESRYNAAKIILGQIEELSRPSSKKNHLPVLLAGDFNSEENQEAYTLLNNWRSSVQDLQHLVAPQNRYGHLNTFTGFGYGPEPEKRIDFLFIEREDHQGSSRLYPESYAVLENRFDDGVYVSDHRAVVGDVRIGT